MPFPAFYAKLALSCYTSRILNIFLQDIPCTQNTSSRPRSTPQISNPHNNSESRIIFQIFSSIPSFILFIFGISVRHLSMWLLQFDLQLFWSYLFAFYIPLWSPVLLPNIQLRLLTYLLSHSLALQPSDSLGLLNYRRPPFPIHCLLSPSLNLHLPQILVHIFQPSQSMSSPSSIFPPVYSQIL